MLGLHETVIMRGFLQYIIPPLKTLECSGGGGLLELKVMKVHHTYESFVDFTGKTLVEYMGGQLKD